MLGLDTTCAQYNAAFGELGAEPTSWSLLRSIVEEMFVNSTTAIKGFSNTAASIVSDSSKDPPTKSQ